MSASTLFRSFRSSTARRWRALRVRTRVALAILAVALLVAGWAFLNRAVNWPARVVLSAPKLDEPIAFSPDGRTILTYHQDGLTPWDATTGRKGTTWTKNGRVLTGAFSPDGRTFAAATSHNPDPIATFFNPGPITIELIDTTSGRSRASLPTRHTTLSTVAFAKDGLTLWADSSAMDGLKEVVTWDASTGQQISARSISAPMKRSNWAVSPDGLLLAILPDFSRAIQLWDLKADRSIDQLTEPAGVASYGMVVAFSADGRTLAGGRVERGH